MSRARVPSAVAQHCRAINALVTKLEHAARKVDEYQRAIGQHIAAVKEARPDDWQRSSRPNASSRGRGPTSYWPSPPVARRSNRSVPRSRSGFASTTSARGKLVR